MEINFNKNFVITMTAMRLNRCHPDIQKGKIWFLKFTITHGIFSIVFITLLYNIIYHDVKNNEFSKICKNGILSSVFLVITLQYSIILWKQNVLKELIGLMRADFELMKSLRLHEQGVVLKYAIKGAEVSKQWFLISASVLCLFVVKNICIYTYNYVVGDFKLVPIYDVVYPFFIEDMRDNLVVYCLSYAVFLYFVIYAAIMYVSFTPLGPIFMLHACGQLEVLIKRVDDIFVHHNEDEVMVEIKYIVVKLQHIYSFVELINDSFSVAYELILKATAVTVPITVYEFKNSIAKGEVSLDFITFIFGCVFISSSPCYYSEILMEKSERFRMAIYSCGWERFYDRRTRTSIALILERSLRPVAIRTMFRTLSLDALTDLFQQSYTIFNVMNAMWD